MSKFDEALEKIPDPFSCNKIMVIRDLRQELCLWYAEYFYEVRTALTQAAEIERGEKVVVDKKLLHENICIIDDFVGFKDLESVNIFFIGYNQSSKEMRVEMENGWQFNYQDVPKDIFDGISAAEHRGKFLQENVKGHYRYYQV